MLFKTLPAVNDTVTIGNPNIGEIEIIKYGSLTIGEHSAYFKKVNELIADESIGGLLDLSLTLWKTTILIQSRLDPSWNHEKTCSPVWDLGEGQLFKPPFALLEAIEKFFDSERKKWSLDEFNLCLQGTESLSLAIKKCDEIPGSKVVTNPSLQVTDTYYVLDDSLVPADSNWITIHVNQNKKVKSPGKS